MVEMHEYWAGLLAEKRARPDDRMLSRLLEAEVVGDDGVATRLTDDEVLGFCQLIGSAGTETVTKLLANAVVLFQRNPDQWRAVLADRSTIPGAVEETLRYWAPSQYQGRVCTEPVTRHGVTVLESRVALEELARRFPDHSVDEAGLERVHMSNVHGFKRVPFVPGRPATG
jgi:cytochrome P450